MAIGLVCAAIPLMLPAAADAGTASVRRVELPAPRGLAPYVYSAASFSASAGERNTLTVRPDGEAFVFRDDGADVTPGKGCAALDARTVRCEPFDDTDLVVETLALGDESDSAAGLAELMEGGPGDDELSGATNLIGGPGDDILRGSDSHNTLEGGDGNDRLLGGGGDDGLRGDNRVPGTDVLDGGPGTDTASWRRHEVRVTIDLADPGPDGAAGERDTLVAIENANGGRASDVLRGDDGPNLLDDGGSGADVLMGRGGPDELRAGSGRDTLRGEGGDDLLTGGSGSDRIDGGDGDDNVALLFSPLGTPDRITCGRGQDRVDDPRTNAFVPADCERVWLFSAGVRLLGRASGGSLLFEVQNLDTSGEPWCALIELGSPRGVLGAAVLDLPAKHKARRRVRVPLTRLGRQVAAGPGIARVPLLITPSNAPCSRGWPRPAPFTRQDGYTFGL